MPGSSTPRPCTLGRRSTPASPRPIAERMRRFRLLRRSGGLLWTLLTHWQLEIETATAKTAEAGDEVEIDLRAPPTRDGVGMTEASGSLIWANAQRRPFRLTVKL